MTPDTVQSIAFFVAGVVGSGCRAAITPDQTTFSRKSLVDLIVGGLVGIIYPLVPLIPIPAAANLMQQAAFIAFLSYATGDLVQSILGRAGIGPKP